MARDLSTLVLAILILCPMLSIVITYSDIGIKRIDLGNGVYREDYVDQGYSLLYIPLSFMSNQIYDYDRDVTPSDPGEGVGVTVYCPSDEVYMAILYVPGEWLTKDGYKLIVSIGYPTHPEGDTWVQKTVGDLSFSDGVWSVENTEPSILWKGHVAVWLQNIMFSTSTGEIVDTAGIYVHIKSACEFTYSGGSHDDADFCPCSGYEKWDPSRYRMVSIRDYGGDFWLQQIDGSWYIVVRGDLMQTNGGDSGSEDSLESKGIWVWGSTIRGYEEEFINWAIEHGFTDIYILIKGVSGTVRYDVLNKTLTLKHDMNLGIRIWAWLVGFHDESHSDQSWDYLVGDWVSPDDSDYRDYLVNIIENALDPSRGYVDYVPDGVMLDDTFQWPSHNYGGNASHRVESITGFVQQVRNVVNEVSSTYNKDILLGFAPHPEIDWYDQDNGWRYAAYEYGQDFGELAKYCDILVPETYRYGFYNEPTSWITEVVNAIYDEINSECPERLDDVRTYPALVLYYSDSDPTPIDASSLQSDIEAALDATNGFSVFRYASKSTNPGNQGDSYDLPTAEQLQVLDQYQPGEGGESGGGEGGGGTPSTGSPWDRRVYGDQRDYAMYHQQPTWYNDEGFGSGEYKGWCGVASLYIALHTLVPDLPARLKVKYPSWSDPQFNRQLIEADPYIYHSGSTYAVEALMVHEGIGYDSGTSGYGYSELDNIIDWLNGLDIGVTFEYQYVSLSQMRDYLEQGWVAVMNVQTGHYVAVVAYTYDDPSDSTKRYYWILDPWPTSYIGPGSTWDPTTEDPDGDGYPEFNVDLTWDWRSLIWSRQPHGTSDYYQGIYVMTGHGVNEVFRDQRGDGTLLMVRLVSNDASNEYVLVQLPSQQPSSSTDGEYIVRMLKMVNGYVYSGAPAVVVKDQVVLDAYDPLTDTYTSITVNPGSIILCNVSAKYMLQAAQATFSYGNGVIFRVDPYSSSTSYSVIKIKRARIFIYTGDGTIYEKVVDVVNWFRFTYDVISDPSKLERLNTERFRYSLILMPGGSATQIATGIGQDNLREIATFVANGGGYIGICAGSYLPVEGYNTETSWLEIVNATVAAQNPGEGIVTIEFTSSSPVSYGFQGQIEMAYYNGPALSPGGLDNTTLGLNAPLPTSIATFTSGPNTVLIGKPAILTTTYGSGKIVLFSPHPEHYYYSSEGDLTLGKYIWRLLWNAIVYATGEEDVIEVSPPQPIPEPAYSNLLILAVISIVAIVAVAFRKLKHR